MRDIAYLGSAPVPFAELVHCKSARAVAKGAGLGRIGALLLDARLPVDALSAIQLLRLLLHDPREPTLHPKRVLGLVSPGDVDVAFDLGSFGIAGVVADPEPTKLRAALERILRSSPEAAPLPLPTVAATRVTRLVSSTGGTTPQVAIAFRHAPETLDLLERYQRMLQEAASESTLFSDVATVLRVLVRDGLTCQTNLACKVGAAPDGQFIGSFEFYRQLRRTRYANIPDPNEAGLPMEAFIAVDEVLHDTLHLLFLANELRAGLPTRSTQFAEELSVSWWQATIHQRAFPRWLSDDGILHINDDFLLTQANEEARSFWKVAHVFAQYQQFPWVQYVLQQLPERAAYIGQRPDLTALVRSFAERTETEFLAGQPAERLGIPAPFAAYPKRLPSFGS